MSSNSSVAVIGAGPAGLMAAETLCRAGYGVDIFDAMPSVGRKFLMAGKGGMNITHSEPFDAFVARYGERAGWLAPLIGDFGPGALREWIHGLGIDTFVGSSGRVFPVEMKAAPLLRAWLHRLRENGAQIHVRHRWRGWDDAGALCFDTPTGQIQRTPVATVLALGGVSWPQLGSDGAWQPWLRERGIGIRPFEPANSGFERVWTPHFLERFVGQPIKNIGARCVAPDGRIWQRQGEAMISSAGIEGGLIYALSAPLRDACREGGATLFLDLLPGFDPARVEAGVAHPRGSRSLSSHLQSRLGLKGVKLGLLHECVDRATMLDPALLAIAIKNLPVKLERPRPIAEAISSAGGLHVEALDENFMLRKLPGVFCAGEMLDWEAPTGGYLLTACFATGHAAGRGAAVWLGSGA